MTYRDIDALTVDPFFAGRVRACTVEQAATYKNDERPDIAAVALACLKGNGETYLTFTRLVGSAPGLAETAGAVSPLDQSRILDADILAAVQTGWPTVASLHFDSQGAPL